MRSLKSNRTYALLIERGENIIESLKRFCAENGITCGHFTGVGAVDEAELAHYVVDDREYSSKKFSGPMEIANLTGNVTTKDGEVYLHAHITLGKQDFSVVAGHLNEARVHAVCEIFLTAVEAELSRKHDENIGLNVFDL